MSEVVANIEMGSLPEAKQKNKTLKKILMNKWLYIFLIPGMLQIIIFDYIPMYGIVIAFKNFNLMKGIWESDWIGIRNFQYLFKSQDFFLILRNSLWFSILRLAWGFPVPIILAIMLNEIKNVLYKRTVQTVLYLPHFISWVVIAGMVINILSPSTGVFNYVVKLFGGQSIPFLQKPEYFRSIIIVTEIWKEAGWGTIIYLAAISGIDIEIYEAAIIDGANRLQRIFSITLPCIMSTIIVLLVLRMGHMLRNGFEQIFLLYNPLVYSVADVFETYTYRVGITQGRFDFATAVGIFQSVVGLVLIIGSNKLAKKVGEGGLW